MSARITKAEFYDKYGDVLVQFSGYYKYAFSYKATLPDGKRIVVDYGGNTGDIYRHDVSPEGLQAIRNLDPYAGTVYEGTKIVEEFYEY